MLPVFSKESIVAAGMCGINECLSVPSAIELFQDAACEHAVLLGADYHSMRKKHNALWVIRRTKLRILQLPLMFQPIQVVTFPNPPMSIRCNRNYQLLLNDRVIIEGRAEWALLDIKSKRIMRISETSYATATHFVDSVCCSESFLRLGDALSEDCFSYECAVKYSDLDVSGHMNNVKYVAKMLDALPFETLHGFKNGEFEIRYLHEAVHGDILRFYAKPIENAWLLSCQSKDKMVVASALLAQT